MTHGEMILEFSAAGLVGCIRSALVGAHRNEDGSLRIGQPLAEVLSEAADKVRLALEAVDAERAKSLSARTLAELPDRRAA